MKWCPQLTKRVALGLGVAAVSAAACFAQVSANVPGFLDGVDASGNPSTTNGRNGGGKSFKDTELGIVVQITGAIVVNDFGRPRVFSDRGVPVIDPVTDETLTATADLEVVTRPFWRNGSFAVQLGIYDPEPVVP